MCSDLWRTCSQRPFVSVSQCNREDSILKRTLLRNLQHESRQGQSGQLWKSHVTVALCQVRSWTVRASIVQLLHAQYLISNNLVRYVATSTKFLVYRLQQLTNLVNWRSCLDPGAWRVLIYTLLNTVCFFAITDQVLCQHYIPALMCLPWSVA